MVARREGRDGIEVLRFRKGDFGTRRNSSIIKHRGRKSVKDKLRAQLLKHYGFVLNDN